MTEDEQNKCIDRVSRGIAYHVYLSPREDIVKLTEHIRTSIAAHITQLIDDVMALHIPKD